MAIFGNATADFVRWIPANRTTSGEIEIMLHKFYPASTGNNFILKYHHTLETFPQSWVVSPARINFHGVDVAISNSPERLLAFKMPLHLRTVLVSFFIQMEVLGALSLKSKQWMLKLYAAER